MAVCTKIVQESWNIFYSVHFKVLYDCFHSVPINSFTYLALIMTSKRASCWLAWLWTTTAKESEETNLKTWELRRLKDVFLPCLHCLGNCNGLPPCGEGGSVWWVSLWHWATHAVLWCGKGLLLLRGTSTGQVWGEAGRHENRRWVWGQWFELLPFAM